MNGTLEQQQRYLADFEEGEKKGLFPKHAWVRPIRRQAIARFSEIGFPTTRQEGWLHTNVAPLAAIPFSPAPRDAGSHVPADLTRWTFGDEECHQLVFVNGRFSEELSSLRETAHGVLILGLGKAIESERNWVEPHLARYASWHDNPFTALNTAFMADGAFVYLPAGTVLKGLIHILFLSTGGPGPWVTHPRVLLVVGGGSEVSVVESYAGLDGGNYFTNAVTEVFAGVGAVVQHYKLQRESDPSFHVSRLEVQLGRNASFSSHSISLGGGLVRNDVSAVLGGEGADVTLNGLYVTRGRQHVDNHTLIVHAKQNCTSRELYKGILDDRSTAVFNGRIIVRPDAQKTNAQQTNRNLLLSEEALVNTAPQLEIFADDVKCTHGATIGQLEDDELFYLRSRGIGEEAARTMLTHAFASELVRSIRIAPVQCQLDLVLLTRLSRAREGEGAQ